MNQKIIRFFDHFEEFLCASMLGAMAAIAFANVISRYFLHYSFAFIEELEVSAFVWITLFGASIGFRRGAHLNVSLLVKNLPKSVQRACVIISGVLGIALFGLLIFYGIGQIKMELLFDTRSQGIGVPQWWYTLGLPLGAALVILRILQTTIIQWKKLS
ncbi:tripartite ATP-independent periplasmic transporter DctQ component [Candidatus Vecturithrix granuli]|uniref:Tripartite ATP-independent periplasmic transporter DctQ component n=1 Tax=Vecturithrix granuli TaxID=1499967 RepID=A0A081C5G4_VECG1|nr:tripartite ATP-independent periplasmic transporter DctQ component [Candidatus Vecturithrix granuli]